MRKACLALVLLAGPALAQSNNINPSQIRPGTEGQVLATKSGKSTWDRGNCGASGTVQLSTGTAGLTCDETVFVDTVAHRLGVGSLPTNHVIIGALGTPTLWTFDTTSPTTARNSLGVGSIAPGTTGQVAVYPSAGMGLAGTSSIGLTSLTLSTGSALTDNQGTGAKVQHSTGSTTAGHLASFDAAGNTVDSGSSAGTDYYFSFTGCTLTVGGNSVDCTGSRSFSAMTPVVPDQPDTNYYLQCNTVTTQGWGSSTGVNTYTTTGFSFASNVDRYNAIPATVTPTVWCHLHHN